MPEDMNEGYIHFAANLVLEDIFHKGESSLYAPLAPAHVLNPYALLHTDEILRDFRRDFNAAEDRYYRLRGTGAVVKGTVSHTDKPNREIVFNHEETDAVPSFTGTLRLSLDKEFYKSDTMPAYQEGKDATFICMEYRPVHDFRNEKTHKVEIRLIQCRTADDYYSDLQQRIQQRLKDIFNGNETVNPPLAKGLAMLYMTGQSLPEDSLCLKGSFMACHENLISELARRYDDVKAENIGIMKTDPEKRISRKIEQVTSGPAIRPANANQSPSGEQIYEQPEKVARQKEAVSQVKNRPSR
ncbi:MAG: hypothetical protein NC211_08925 [Alistipes senegalensis]|nr:hypothetical protein [Oxalobacter formigenes]MCM1281930.1 hypothetical protein [Alistipes senegalensis]